MIGLVECDFGDEGLICVGAGIAALQMTCASDVRPAYLFDILSAAHGFALLARRVGRPAFRCLIYISCVPSRQI